MIKKILFSLLVVTMIACGQESTKELKTPSGYKYTHLKTNGQKVQPGDFVYFTIKMVGDNGKVFQEILEGPTMPALQIPTEDKPLPTPNPVVEMLTDASLGDSLTLYMPVDSFPNKTAPEFQGVEFIKYETQIKMIKNEDEYKAYMEEQRLEQEKKIEASKERKEEVAKQTEEILQDYADGKLDVQKTEEGLEYVILEQGDGPFGAKGKRVAVHYYGALMDGKMFDTSFNRGQEFTFTVGRGEVIQGWDIGIPLLKKGGKAALFIPYDLAYGAAGSPPRIPEKADLMFYVELNDVN